jgi:hypothetical protein
LGQIGVASDEGISRVRGLDSDGHAWVGDAPNAIGDGPGSIGSGGGSAGDVTWCHYRRRRARRRLHRVRWRLNRVRRRRTRVRERRRAVDRNSNVVSPERSALCCRWRAAASATHTAPTATGRGQPAKELRLSECHRAPRRPCPVRSTTSRPAPIPACGGPAGRAAVRSLPRRARRDRG